MLIRFIPILMSIGAGLLFVILSFITATYIDMALVSGQPLSFINDSLNSIKKYPGLIVLYFIWGSFSFDSYRDEKSFPGWNHNSFKCIFMNIENLVGDHYYKILAV